jgi:hypothetical protein
MICRQGLACFCEEDRSHAARRVVRWSESGAVIQSCLVHFRLDARRTANAGLWSGRLAIAVFSVLPRQRSVRHPAPSSQIWRRKFAKAWLVGVAHVHPLARDRDFLRCEISCYGLKEHDFANTVTAWTESSHIAPRLLDLSVSQSHGAGSWTANSSHITAFPPIVRA